MAALGEFAQTLKQQADIVRIVGEYVGLKRAGGQNYIGLCPFHNEKTPSFSVHATRQFFHCFGCGVSGDVYHFIQKIEDVTFPEAIRTLAQKLGIPMPKMTFNSPVDAEAARLRGSLLDIQERACTLFQEYLRRPEAASARDYLKNRGLDESTIAAFRIGFAPDSGFLLKDRLKGEFEEEVLRASGLFTWKEAGEARGGIASAGTQAQARRLAGDDARKDDAESNGDDKPAPADAREAERQGQFSPDLRSETPPKTGVPALSALYSKFRNRIMFPISNESGKIIAFTGRTLSADEKAGPKYLNSPETAIYSKSRVLFNLDRAREAIKHLGYVILVEGQMDCISLYASGLRNVIASSGTAFTEIQARLLGRFSKNIVVNFDPDTAGARATERTLGLLVEEEFTIKVLTLEDGLDPDLFIRRKGKAAYEQALAASQPYFAYLIDRARAQFPVRSAEAKVKAVNYLLPHIQRVPSRIVRDELALEISQKLGIDSGVLRQELKHAATSRAAGSVKAPPEAQVNDAERIMIRALVSANEMQTSQDHISGRDGAEEDFDPARQARFALESENLHQGLATEALIRALLETGGAASNLMDLPLNDSDRRLLATLLLRDQEELSPERVEGAIRGLRRIHLRRRLEQVQAELASPKSRDAGRMQELLQEKVRLKRALMDPGLSDAASGATPF